LQQQQERQQRYTRRHQFDTTQPLTDARGKGTGRQVDVEDTGRRVEIGQEQGAGKSQGGSTQGAGSGEVENPFQTSRRTLRSPEVTRRMEQAVPDPFRPAPRILRSPQPTIQLGDDEEEEEDNNPQEEEERVEIKEEPED